MNRRNFLQMSSGAVASIGLGLSAADSKFFPAKAKKIIYLTMSGGPSQQDLFDYKPLLNQHHGKEMFSTKNKKLVKTR